MDHLKRGSNPRWLLVIKKYFKENEKSYIVSLAAANV